MLQICFLQPSINFGIFVPQLVRGDDLEDRAEFQVIPESGTNLIKVENPIGLSLVRTARSNLHWIKGKKSTKTIINSNISTNSAEEIFVSGVNLKSGNGRDVARMNRTLVEMFGHNSISEQMSTNVTEAEYRNIFETGENRQFRPKTESNNFTINDLRNAPNSFPSPVQFNVKERRSLDNPNNSSIFTTTEIANDGYNTSEVMSTTAVAAVHFVSPMAASGEDDTDDAYNGDDGEYYNEGDYYGEDYEENYSKNNNTSGSAFVEENSGDFENYDEDSNSGNGNKYRKGDSSGDEDHVIEQDNSGDNFGTGAGDYDNSGDNSEMDESEEGNSDGSGEESGDYAGFDIDNYYDINDYDYDRDEVDETGTDAEGVLDIGDIGNDWESLEKIFPPHFIKLLLEKYYRTQQMMMTINIFETKETEN